MNPTPSSADPTKTHVARELKHTSPLVSCRFDPSGRYVFTGVQENKVLRWDLNDGTKVELVAHDSWVRALACIRSKDGEKDITTLVTGGYDGRLVWWPAEAEKPEPIRKIDAHQGWVKALAVTPDQNFLLSCGNDNLVKLWRASDGALVREFVGHTCHVYNVAVHPNGQQIVSGDLKANLIHWDLESGKQLRQFRATSMYKYDDTFWADIGGFRALEFNRDGTRLAGCGITNVTNAFAGIGNATVVVFDWDAGKEQSQHLAKQLVNGDAWGVILHPQDFIIGLSGGGGGGILYFWKFGEKNEFHSFKLPNTARDLALSPDGVHLATAHHDGGLRLCKMAPKT